MMIRETFLSASEIAIELLRSPAVAAAWGQPSALPELGVGGLAGHLGSQVAFIPRMLDTPVPAEEPISLTEHFARAAWVGADIDSDSSMRIRTMAEDEGGAGPSAVADLAAAALAQARAVLPSAPDRTARQPSWTGWSLRFDDFVVTRILELVVHSDDLAYSVGLPTPAFPTEANDLVIGLLTRIAVRRHGATNVIRALSRAERAPTIAAI